MLLPYRTTANFDGPPRGTYALIAANALVFLLARLGWIDPDSWTLEWGRIDPLSWVQRSFLHLDGFHLAGNLIFLWVFAQIVEGAVGTRNFLILVLGILLASGGLESYAYRNVEGGSFGASGLVFGCMASAVLLAPRTRLSTIFWYFTLPRRVDIPMPVFAAVLIALDLSTWVQMGAASIVIAAETGGRLPPALHMIGLATGGALTYLGLKLGLLDAGGFDCLSKRRPESDGKLGDYVMPASDSELPEPKSDVPKCPHCDRPRPAKLARCIYCGEQ